MARKPVLALAAAALGLARPAAAQEPWDLWSITGSNTLRVEHYDIDGNRGAGPYLFDGPQAYDEIGLTASRAFSPWDRLRIQLYGVLNDSDYRSRDKGIVPERMTITRENGEGAVPYRVEAGDTFAYFSYRTLQRSLKGLQVELQPGAGQSLVFLAGVNQPYWRHVQKDDDLTAGASWLMALGPATQVGANFVHNARQADEAAGTPDRDQDVISLTGDHAWEAGTHRLRVEGEVAGFRGDHDGSLAATGTDGRDRRGQGYFAQLSGRDAASPLDYRLRFEQYDRDFRPNGAVILFDRRAIEAFAGWRFPGGLSLRGRAQEFNDARESGNAQKTRTAGANLSGPFGAGGGIVGQFDAFVQDATNEAATLDRRSWVASANLGGALGGGWHAQLGLYHQSVDDRIAGAADPVTSQVTAMATRAWSAGAVSATVSPGLTWRRVSDEPGAVTEVTPVLNFSVAGGPHSVNGSLGRQRLDPRLEGAFDVRTTNARLDYRFVEGRHVFGAEALRYDRATDQPGGATDTWRVALFWTMAFDKPARTSPGAAPAAPVATAYATPVGRDISALLALGPGTDAATAERRLREGGLTGISRQPGLLVVEARLLAEVESRQRLAFAADSGRIARSALVVSFDDAASPGAFAREFERVRRALLDRFGPPESNFEEGAFDAGFVNALNAGRFIRVMEWPAASGRLRFGIPRRLDGQVRMELQYAPAFGTPRDALWSLEAVR